MLSYELKRLATGEVTIDVKMTFKSALDAMDAVAKLEGFSVGDTLDFKILEFLKEGQLLGAVKFYKDQTGLGLKEAKEYCDGLKIKFTTMGLIPQD